MTGLALACFAGNSLLSRYALGASMMDAASFTVVRLTTGALVLLILERFLGARARHHDQTPPDRWTALALFLYAACFAFAYRQLSTATGALILFAAVQTTMLVGALRSGETLTAAQWAGLATALSGLVYLLAPGLEAPPVKAAGLMVFAGSAWGVYSLRSRRASDPLGTTARHFRSSVPLALVLWLGVAATGTMQVTKEGLLVGLLCGTITSGLGYVFWIGALERLRASHAATLQLSVPVLAAVGGVLWLSEPISWRLLVASAVILGGIGATLARLNTSHKVPATPTRAAAHSLEPGASQGGTVG